MHPAVEQYRSGDQKTKRRRIYKIIAAACFVPLFLLEFIIFDSIYYPTVETEDFSMSDSACLVCTKEGNIYILYRNNAKRLELPVLDFYREKTGEKAKVQATQNGTVKMGSIEYNIRTVKVEDAFAGAARVGISFDGSLIKYNYSDEEETVRTRFLWLLDESYEEKNFLTEHDMNIIPCSENVSGRKYNSAGGLGSSDVILGAEVGELLTKRINMSFTSSDDENAFYLVHPAGTVVIC